jgi:pyruvate,orthophosphate dikinase
MDEVHEYLEALEKKTGKGFGNPENPLLVSVRSGSALSMPGMMDTILNLGLNDETVKGFIALTQNDRLFTMPIAFCSFSARSAWAFKMSILTRYLRRSRKNITPMWIPNLTPRLSGRVCDRFKELIKQKTGKPFPRTLGPS